MAFYWLERGIRSARQEPQRPSPQTVQQPPPSSNPYHKPQQQSAKQKPKQALLARDIMHSPVSTLSTTASFEEAQKFIRVNRYRHVPIVDESGKLAGVVSDRDVLREAANMNHSANAWIAEVVLESRTVQDFMVKRILTATPGVEIRLVAKAMFEEKIGSMPIVDDDGRLVGIITRSDILRALISNAPIEMWI